MAGAHKIDQPLGDEVQNAKFMDDLEQESTPWTQVEEEQVLGNGIAIAAGSVFRREIGEFGHGLAVKGTIRIGTLTFEIDGSEEQRHDIPDGHVISAHCNAREGAWVDSLMVLWGPAGYHGLTITEDGCPLLWHRLSSRR